MKVFLIIVGLLAFFGLIIPESREDNQPVRILLGVILTIIIVVMFNLN